MSFHAFSDHMGQFLKMHTMWSHSVTNHQEHIMFLLVVAHSTHEMSDDHWHVEQTQPQRHFAEQSPLFLDVLRCFERCGKLNKYHCGCGSCKRISVANPPRRSSTNSPRIITCVDTCLYVIHYDIFWLMTYYIHRSYKFILYSILSIMCIYIYICDIRYVHM